MKLSLFFLSGLLGQTALAAADNTTTSNTTTTVESRSLDEIYQAALAEGGVVTCWHGGDETTQQDALKAAFEAKFPGVTLNITVDLSKYHDGNLDHQLANDNVYVDSIILQTLHDYPRWADEGALLDYAPLGFDQIYPAFKDASGAARYYGVYVFSWGLLWNTDKLPDASFTSYEDFLKPEFKDKLVLTYPNDDDAVLWQFDLIIQQLGESWFESLLAQNPRWVRGTATPDTVLRAANQTEAASFTAGAYLQVPAGDNINSTFPSAAGTAPFVAWPQHAAILKDAPHPEAAKLLHNFVLTDEYQQASGGWPVRVDATLPSDTVPYPAVWDMANTNASAFGPWMADRARVERLRFYFEDKIGSAQGLSPLVDDL